MFANTMTRSEPNRFASYSTIVLPLLLVACASSGGPAPDEPPAPAAGEPSAAIQPATADDGAATPPAPADTAAEPAMSSSPVAAYLGDPAAITAGRRMFRAVCTGYCHSTTPGVTKDAPNLFDCDWDHGSTDADLYRVINQGVPDTEMLPFEGKIPEDTIWKVIAYMRSNSLDCG
ncbi:MAG: c-type cytochrome [Acidobacteria bacterium]|nr:c-type cytochrome [Acidobacteriota bacterium]